MLLRIAVQAKGRLYDETMSFLGESDIKLNAVKRSLLVQSSNFPVEVLFLRDDDIPQSVATGVADIGIVGENEYVEKNENAEIVKRIFDIVSSGSTLVSNRLREVEVVMKSEALLIGNRNLCDEKKEILKELLFRMDAVKTAEDKKYVLMNAPKEQLEEIIQVLPGMKSPTVMPLAQEGWCSVHTVLDEKCFWEIIGKLKSLGAEGILVLPIEKMIL